MRESTSIRLGYGLLLLFVLAGCGVPPPKREEVSASYAGAGQASIEWTKDGNNHFHVFFIDGEYMAGGRQFGIFPLAPGPHVLQANVSHDHMTLVGRAIAGGAADLHLQAEAGVRYGVSGRMLGRNHAELWIVDLTTGKVVSDRQMTFMHDTVQHDLGPSTLDPEFWGGLLGRDAKGRHALAELDIGILLVRQYIDEPTATTRWEDAPGPKLLIASKDLTRIQMELAEAAAKDGYTVDVGLPHRLQLSRRLSWQRKIKQVLTGDHSTDREFADFLFEETAEGTLVYASRSEQVGSAAATKGTDPVLNRREFEQLKALLTAVKKKLETKKT